MNKVFVSVFISIGFLFLYIFIVSANPYILDEADTLNINQFQFSEFHLVSQSYFSGFYLLESKYGVFIPHYIDNFGILGGLSFDHFYFSNALVPMYAFGHSWRFSLKDGQEFNLAYYLKSASFLKENLAGPEVLVDFGWKKRLLQVKSFIISYEISHSIFYNARPGIGFDIGNSLLIGSHNKKVNPNFMLCWQNAIIVQSSYIYMPPYFNNYFILNRFNYTSAISGQFNLSLKISEHMYCQWGFFLQYELVINLDQFDSNILYSFKYREFYHEEFLQPKLVGHFNGGALMLWGFRFTRQN